MTKQLSLACAIIASMLSLDLGHNFVLADNLGQSLLVPEFEEIRGYVSVESHLYPQREILDGQSRHQASIAVEP